MYSPYITINKNHLNNLKIYLYIIILMYNMKTIIKQPIVRNTIYNEIKKNFNKNKNNNKLKYENFIKLYMKKFINY